jgi:hypothetical protein
VGELLESKHLEQNKNEVETQKVRIRKIRENVDLLTKNVVVHLNEINRVLTEVEQSLLKQNTPEET